MANPIRLVLLVADFDTENTGGLTRFAEALAYALDKDQFKVSIVALWKRHTIGEATRISRLKDAGFSPITLADFDAAHPYRAFRNAFRVLPKTIAQLTPDLIHCHSEFGEIALVFLKLLGKLPCPALRTAHNFEWKKRPLRRLLLSRFAYLWTYTAEYGVSSEIVKLLNKRWGATPAKYIPNAVDLTRFAAASADNARLAHWNIPKNAPLIISIGRLAPQKGFQDLIAAAELVLQTQPDVYFLILGEGPARPTLQAQIDAANLQSHVILAGTQTQIETLLPCATLYVSSSHWEGLPTVVLESMAAGVPVIATDIPGSNTLVQHNKTGWLVPVQAPAALARQISDSLTAPNLAAVTQHALQHTAQFDIQRIAQQYTVEYTRLLA